MVENESSDVWPVPPDFLEPGIERQRGQRQRRVAVVGDPPGRGFHPDFVLSVFTEMTESEEPSSTE